MSAVLYDLSHDLTLNADGCVLDVYRRSRDRWSRSLQSWIEGEDIDQVALQKESAGSIEERCLKRAAGNHHWGLCEEVAKFAMFSRLLARVEEQQLRSLLSSSRPRSQV